MKNRAIVLILGFCLLFAFPATGIVQSTTAPLTPNKTGQIPPGIDLDVTFISREPRYAWDAEKQWPDPYELVTFTAHVINKGTADSGAFGYQWQIDNRIVLTGSVANLEPQEETTVIYQWSWKTGTHSICFEADPPGEIIETYKTNNIICDDGNAMTISFWVEESVYNEINNVQSGAGTYSFEDWAQHIIQTMNEMFINSRHPFAPKGIATRVRLDNIILASDGSLFNQGPWHAPEDTIYDGRWGFSMEEYNNCSSTDCIIMPYWVIHELGHYLYSRIDLYAFDVQGGDVKIRDDNGNLIAGTPLLPFIRWDVVHYSSRNYDMMHTPNLFSIFSDYTTYGFNMDWPSGKRTHRLDWEYYFLELPTENRLRVVDNNGQPMQSVKISLYQAVTGDGSSGPYSQEFDNIPDISGVTNDQGIVSLGSAPFGDLDNIGTPAGVALIRLDNPENGEYRYTWIELIDFNMAYWRGETNYYEQEIIYPAGPLTLKLSDTNVTFTAYPGMIGLTPKSVQISVSGNGVAYWLLEPTSVPWIKTIPMSNQDEFPPGPLDIIADPTGLPTGTYSTTITIDAWEGVANSPATINVIMSVIDPYIINLPQIYHSPD